MKRKPLVLAYFVVAFGVLALAGQLLAERSLIAFGGGCAILFAFVHAIAFVRRVRRRKQPARLGRSGRVILGITLAAVIGVLVANFVIIATHARSLASGESGVGFMWLTILFVLAVRAWVVPSARRAAVLQLVAIVLGAPQLTALLARISKRQLGEHPAIDAILLVTFTVIAAAGPVLDRLYADVADRDPGPLPEAIVHH